MCCLYGSMTFRRPERLRDLSFALFFTVAAIALTGLALFSLGWIRIVRWRLRNGTFDAWLSTLVTRDNPEPGRAHPSVAVASLPTMETSVSCRCSACHPVIAPQLELGGFERPVAFFACVVAVAVAGASRSLIGDEYRPAYGHARLRIVHETVRSDHCRGVVCADSASCSVHGGGVQPVPGRLGAAALLL